MARFPGRHPAHEGIAQTRRDMGRERIRVLAPEEGARGLRKRTGIRAGGRRNPRRDAGDGRPVRRGKLELELQGQATGHGAVPPPAGERGVGELVRVGRHALDPVGRHGRGLVAQRDQHEVERVPEVLRLAEPQHVEPAEDGQVAADAGLQVKGPCRRAASAVASRPEVRLRVLAAEHVPRFHARRQREAAVVVLVQHDHPPVGPRRRLGRIRDVHVERDAVILRDLGDVAELDRVVEPRHRLLRDEPLEEQAVLKLEARDHEEQQARDGDDAEEEAAAGQDDAPVGDLAQPPEKAPPVGMRGPERNDPAHGELGGLPPLARGGDRHHEKKPERAGREHEDLRGKQERHREDARHHDQEEPEHDDLEVVAARPVAHPPVEKQEKVKADDRGEKLAREPEVAREEEDDRGEREAVAPDRHARGQRGPRESDEHPRRRDAGQEIGVDVQVEHRRDREEHDHAAEEPPQQLELVRAKSRPSCFH